MGSLTLPALDPESDAGEQVLRLDDCAGYPVAGPLDTGTGSPNL